jgi:hypothetical protein
MHTKIIAGLTSLVTTVTHAAEITWQPPAAVTQAADILNPIGSTVHIAADFNNATGFASGDDDTINGIPFVLTPSAGSGNLIPLLKNCRSRRTPKMAPKEFEQTT